MEDREYRGGFTLVEVIVVVVILGILATLAVSSFLGVSEKYKVESETKQLFADIMDVRGRAMQRNRFYFVRMGASGYGTFEDCNPTPDGNCNFETGLDNQVASVNLTHTIVPALVGGTANFAFNRNGIATDTGFIRLTSTANPDYDCITIGETRIKMGKYNGTNCVEK